MPTATDLAIDLRDAAKTYKSFKQAIPALQGVDLQVQRGELFGLLGPNGAGKSTLVKILMTVINPTRAGGTMLGQPIGHKPTLARVGYLPEHHRFPDYLTATQILHFFGAMSGVDRATRTRLAPKLLDAVGLANVGRKTVRQFSKGMRQRLGLAQALINDPDLLLLDEPTDGVDPEGRRDIRQLLLELKRQGKAVLVNSHILAELELIIDRAAIIYAGKLHDQGTIDQLTSYARRYEIDALPPATSPTAPPPDFAPGQSQVVTITRPGAPTTGEGVTLPTRFDLASLDPADLQPVLDRLRAASWQITRVQLVRPTLEDAFIRTIDRAKAGAK
jgi:ABC-2 type transport system ATP-binding protein